MDAAEIKKAVKSLAFNGFEYVTTEFSPYHSQLRFDVVGIRRYDKACRIVEVKSCRADFLRDKKWKDYLPFAIFFYFAAPEGAIRPDELPPEVGLITMWRLESGWLTTEYTKKCKRLPPLSETHYVKLVEGAYIRLKYELEGANKLLRQMGVHHEQGLQTLPMR